MTSRTFALIACTILLAAAAGSPAQDTPVPPANTPGPAGPAGPAAPMPQSVDDMIATALRASPEVLLAEAKLRQAQAELNQVRLQVTRAVVRAFNDRKHQASVVKRSELRVKELLAVSGQIGPSDLAEANSQMSLAQLSLAQAEAEIRYLLGAGSQMRSDALGQPAPATTVAGPTVTPAARPMVLPEELVVPLEHNVTANFASSKLPEVLNALSEQARVSIIVDAPALAPESFEVSLVLREPVKLYAVLQALTDQHQIAFVLRDYGIFATSQDRAWGIRAPAIPDRLFMRADAE